MSYGLILCSSSLPTSAAMPKRHALNPECGGGSQSRMEEGFKSPFSSVSILPNNGSPCCKSEERGKLHIWRTGSGLFHPRIHPLLKPPQPMFLHHLCSFTHPHSCPNPLPLLASVYLLQQAVCTMKMDIGRLWPFCWYSESTCYQSLLYDFLTASRVGGYTSSASREA